MKRTICKEEWNGISISAAIMMLKRTTGGGELSGVGGEIDHMVMTPT
jgi:hypothetical protein